jgi:hypothetical protein
LVVKGTKPSKAFGDQPAETKGLSIHIDRIKGADLAKGLTREFCCNPSQGVHDVEFLIVGHVPPVRVGNVFSGKMLKH